MRRDTQRAKLYAADDVIEKYATPLPTVQDVERFVKRVMSSKRVQENWPRAQLWSRVKVGDGRRCRNALGSQEGIKIPRWARKSNVVIHEIAHTISLRQWGNHIPGHGWEFCSVYLKLVLYFMGREAHDEMKASFKKSRVRFTEPRKRKPMDPDRKAELVARLAAYRAAQQQLAA